MWPRVMICRLMAPRIFFMALEPRPQVTEEGMGHRVERKQCIGAVAPAWTPPPQCHNMFAPLQVRPVARAKGAERDS